MKLRNESTGREVRTFCRLQRQRIVNIVEPDLRFVLRQTFPLHTQVCPRTTIRACVP